MYLKEKQYKIAMPLLCPVQGPWASSFRDVTGNSHVFNSPPVKPEGTIGLHSDCLSVSLSVCPSVYLSHSFSELSHILMKVGSKLPFEELQIKFDFRHA